MQKIGPTENSSQIFIWSGCRLDQTAKEWSCAPNAHGWSKEQLPKKMRQKKPR